MAVLTNGGLLVIANNFQADLLLTTKVALFQAGFEPTPNSVKDDFDAEECDFDGYTEGGKTLGGGFLNPYFDRSNEGVLLQAASQQWDYVDPGEDPRTSNVVGGYYVYDASNAVISYEIFDEGVPMSANGDACVVIPTVPIS